MIVVKIIGSFLASILISYVLPNIYEMISGRIIKWNGYKFFALLFFVMLFWRDYFFYTLSDIPAVLCLYFSIIMLREKKLLCWFLSGLFVAASINMRPVYMVVAPVFILLTMVYLFERKIILRNVVVLVFGISIIFAPQVIINYTNFNSLSPLVLAKSNKFSNLYIWHLQWGMKIQKFETNIGYREKDKPCAVIDDPAGRELISEVNGDKEFKSMLDYLKGVVKRPFDYALLYMRHLFNIFDIKYATPYIKDSEYKLSLGFSIVNYIVFFIGIFSCIRILFKKNKLKSFLILLMPVSLLLASIPIVVECRFGMPLHLIIIVFACFGLNPVVLNRFFMRNKYIALRMLCVFAVWITMCIYLTMHFHQFTYHRASFAG